MDDGRKLSVHIILQQTGVVLQVGFTGSAPKQISVTGGTEIYRLYRTQPNTPSFVTKTPEMRGAELFPAGQG